MTNQEIIEKQAAIKDRIKKYKQKIEVLQTKYSHLCDLCPHNEKESWTNNDGDGQFTVERCKICGRQRDGGL